jgi:hypothetical protein
MNVILGLRSGFGKEIYQGGTKEGETLIWGGLRSPEQR